MPPDSFAPAELASFTDKDSKVSRFRQLYETKEFIEAYAAHTDLRVADDPHQAIGGEWETHGILQRDFLIGQGLRPQHRLLDLGCGTGRLARRVVPYLNEGNYVGADISRGALNHLADLGRDEGWSVRRPWLIHVPSDGTLRSFQDLQPFDMVWSHSVWTHLPSSQICDLLKSLAPLLAPGAKYLFTYKRGHNGAERTGLKQFRYADEYLKKLVASVGVEFESHPRVWPASQRTGLIRQRAA